MNQKGFVNIVLVVLVVVLVGVAAYLIWVKKPAQPTLTPISTPTSTSTLSNDRKSIIANGTTLLVIDNDEIFNFFKEKSYLCDEGYNINIPGRRTFCENKEVFKGKTRFVSIVLSPDKTKIGFTIESDELSPDSVVGIFYPTRQTNKIYFLTGYYLGNEFISFSPNGTHFVYQGGCWEGMCGLVIKDSETLANKLSLNNPEFADFRRMNAEFVRWVSDNEVEYKLGSEVKRASF